jgi:rSAM/selenodomain-associated transferase 1
MVKAPRPGQVKTRLVPPLSNDEAASLYRCFLIDIFRKLSYIPDTDIFVAYSPEGSSGEIKPLAPEGFFYLPQDEADLGERMLNVFKYLSGSYAVSALIGSDAPDIPEEYIEAAFNAIEEGAEAVFGPAVDGGYYLVGLKRPLPSVFEGIEWSTASVMEKTIERLNALSIPFTLLPVWHDIDRPADLVFLKDNPGCPESAAFLANRDFR